MRILVCGGRNYSNFPLVKEVLEQIDYDECIDVVIHGAAPGLDRLAQIWCESRGCPDHPFPANWNKHGRAAGPIRNQEMIDVGQPNWCVAFPGGAGTKDMVNRAREAGLKIVEIQDG